jgi:hypothetical protein
MDTENDPHTIHNSGTPDLSDEEMAKAFLGWLATKDMTIYDDGDTDVNEVFDPEFIIMMNFHLLDTQVLDAGHYLTLKIESSYDYTWNYDYDYDFNFAFYTLKLLEMHPSAIISMVLQKCPFTKDDFFEESEFGNGDFTNWEEHMSFADFFDRIRTEIDKIIPVFSDGHYYYLNLAQKAEYDRLVTAYTPLAHWSEGRKRVRDGTAPIPGNNILRTVEGLPRGAIAEIYMQLNMPHDVARGGAGGD